MLKQNIIKKKALNYALMLSIFIVGSLTISQNGQLQALSSCMKNDKNSSFECINVAHKYSANRSWIAWFSGKSKTPQFHFLDFIELLQSLKG